MGTPELVVTYRKGKPLAAYYYLNREPGLRSVNTRFVEPEMVIDFDADGSPIGIEIITPELVMAADLNRVLAGLGFPTVPPEQLAPLRTA